jgi:hypothetical protein
MEDKFNDLGVDAIVGSDLMYKVGITQNDLAHPQAFEKMRDIIQYLKQLPPEERSHMMNKVLTGKNINKLDHMWGYIELSKKAQDKVKELDLLKEELSFYER